MCLLYMCEAEYMHVYPPTLNHFHSGACGSQKRVLDFLELELQVTLPERACGCGELNPGPLQENRRSYTKHPSTPLDSDPGAGGSFPFFRPFVFLVFLACLLTVTSKPLGAPL